MLFSIYRYNPEIDKNPRMQNYNLDLSLCEGVMLLDALIAIKAHLDESISFRRFLRYTIRTG